jgi:hypothetical protein
LILLTWTLVVQNTADVSNTIPIVTKVLHKTLVFASDVLQGESDPVLS